MQKEIPKTTAIAVILIVLVILVTLLGWWYTAGGRKHDEAGDLSKRAMEILKRTGGNVQMMTPEEKKVFDEAVSRGLVPAAAVPGARIPAAPASPGGMPPTGGGGFPPSDVGGMAR
jgi:hypothetical protein